MARKGYITISLPEALVAEIDRFISVKKRGYVSRGELVKEAVRNLMDK